MKTRYGFVSNSSSSSFILNFPNGKPKSKDELQKILFGERKEYHVPYDTEFYPSDVIADAIWSQLSIASVATKEEILNIIKNGYPSLEPWVEKMLTVKYPEVDNYATNNKISWKVWEAEHNKYAEQFMTMFHDDKYYILEFSDRDSSLQGAIEHGTALNSVTTLKISHH